MIFLYIIYPSIIKYVDKVNAIAFVFIQFIKQGNEKKVEVCSLCKRQAEQKLYFMIILSEIYDKDAYIYKSTYGKERL